MAPLLLLFLLGGLCALFSLTTSSRASAAKKCGDVKSGDAGKDGSEGEAAAAAARQGTRKQARPDPEADLGIVFSTFDHDGDGFITAVELEESLRRLGIAVSADEAAAMVARVDANSDGLIDIHEFRELYDSIPKKRKHQHPAAADLGAAREVDLWKKEQQDEWKSQRM
ncbi:hypothetical protein C2845_PM09G04240 [Panicum miliaceum]|uniref:EF-hand domain-containing protein n=1 Tax=Panicum miliaceum TaxID=4540 RepID=A0A3L6S286_PANMI|nr:hypothetical protein C2845_PM09G04240 [Panicum miliaceum]